MNYLRQDLHRPVFSRITQGTIFSCAQAARYEGCIVHGLTITARCDVAQDKYPILNYLPIVRLEDWLKRDGLDIILDNEEKEANGKIKRIFKEEKISENVIKFIRLTDVVAKHFNFENPNKSQKKKRENIENVVNLINTLEKIKYEPEESQHKWICSNRPQKVHEIVSRLSQHKMLGYYFFETLNIEDSNAQGYVCLLREVNTLPKYLIKELGRGISNERYKELCKHPSSSLGLQVRADDMAMPVIQVSSPTIEHILQSFSQLFGRIGLPDADEEVIYQIAESQIKLGEKIS